MWIKCSERLPAKYEYVLAGIQKFGTGEPHSIGIARVLPDDSWEWLSHDDACFSCDMGCHEDPLGLSHWCYIPEFKPERIGDL